MNYQLLDQFKGMECEVGVRLLKSSNLDATFIYHSFNYYLEDNQIFLEDGTNSREANTYFGLDEIKEIKNLNEDKDDPYHDVVTFMTDEYVIDVCTLEEPFQYPKCHKCGIEIQIPEAVNWHILGHDCYENPYDGDSDVVGSLNFCSNCIQEFVGSIENDDYFN